MKGGQNVPRHELPGRIVSAHGRRVVVEDTGGNSHACRLFGRRLQVVCGDRVTWVRADAEGATGMVVGVEPRSTELARISSSGTGEVIVANLDQLVAVVAPVPAADFSICDRYLAAAEWADLAAVVVLNKSDLPEAAAPGLEAELATYRALDYPTIVTSKRSARGIESLGSQLRDRVSVLVGQSGVGKSSLINLLVPGVEATVQEISRASEEGRHTTTASALYHLPGGGDLIDSPGVRDYAPPLPAPRDVATGFRELAAAGQACKFPDCRHMGEPGCAVEPLVGCGRISRRRLASYRQLLKLAMEVEQRLKSTGRTRLKERTGPRFRK
jgi:ribosome biogenesis GTPase